jgi:hypothetical protein
MVAPALVAALLHPCTPMAAALWDLLSIQAYQSLFPASGAANIPGNIHIFPMMHNPNNSPSARKKEGV